VFQIILRPDYITLNALNLNANHNPLEQRWKVTKVGRVPNGFPGKPRRFRPPRVPGASAQEPDSESEAEA
jgi:hypothetical protein